MQIFGTDLNEKGIQKARAGVYRESIADEISAERMERFFVKVEEGYRVNKAVRDMCVFARQNLASDPPFSQMNVVACRNLLIYIQPVLQKKIIAILHYALKPSGFLILGSSESVSGFPDLFSTLDKKQKIYAKKAIASRLHYDFSQLYYPPSSKLEIPSGTLTPQGAPKIELDVEAEADRLVLKSHSPVGVVINSAMEVVQFRGRTTPYLEAGSGKPSLNVLKLAQHGLSLELRMLISAAEKKSVPVRKDGVLFEGDGVKRMLNLSVSPLGEKRDGKKGRGENRSYLILFEDVTSRGTSVIDEAPQGNAKSGAGNKGETKRLMEELAATQDTLRSAMESEDSLKEEFQSANEEILSANEELQSSNEELETSKEELQSANEELNTLNAELRFKNTELHDLNNDISNLLNSTRIPVVMLDRRLRIRRLTPAADKLLKVVPSDIGRSVADIRLNIQPMDLESSGLEPMIAKVLESLQPTERDVRDMEGHWHSLNILPYQTQDNKIDGVVLALQDIDAIKIASEQLSRSAEFFRGVMDTVREPLLVLDADLKINAANESFYDTFKVSPEQTVNQDLFEVGAGQWDIPKLRRLLEESLPKGQVVTDFEVEHDFEGIGRRTMLLNARRLAQADKRKPMILLAIEDVTERKQAEAILRESEERFRTLFDLDPIAVYYCDASGVIENFNRHAAELWGRTPAHGDTDEHFCGSFKLFRQDGSFMPHEDCPMAEVISGKIQEARDQEVLIERPDGSRITVVVNIRPFKNQRGEITGAINCFYDITERKMAQAALIKSEKLAAAGRLAATLAHEINNPLQAVTNLMMILRHSPTVGVQDQAYVAIAEEELGRVGYLTQQSLGFYREAILPTGLDVNEVIGNVLDLYANRIKAKQITATKRYLQDEAIINSFPGEIRQVFSTLLINAMEAVPMGGTIAIRVRKSHHWENRAIPGTRGVRIVIADNGVGIPAHNTARLFEPFFTTKGENGTGLGLWVAQSILSRLGGSIRMRSSVRAGKCGTYFSIFLPLQLPNKPKLAAPESDPVRLAIGDPGMLTS